MNHREDVPPDQRRPRLLLKHPVVVATCVAAAAMLVVADGAFRDGTPLLSASAAPAPESRAAGNHKALVDAYAAIVPADSTGALPPIPPSEMWPSQ